LAQLQDAVSLARTRSLTALEKQGLIQSFEFSHELAWNVIKDFFLDQGNPSIAGSRDATREAFKAGLLKNGEIWMEMIKSRNQTSHTYNKAVAEEIVGKVIDQYLPELESFIQTMGKRA
jgi:nucleotidyltransferase substrate binding protein (TIGR01987 family)